MSKVNRVRQDNALKRRQGALTRLNETLETDRKSFQNNVFKKTGNPFFDDFVKDQFDQHQARLQKNIQRMEIEQKILQERINPLWIQH